VKEVTEELCGHEFSSATSRMVQTLDEELEKFARRRLEEPYRYLSLDARYEKVREDGTVPSQVVLVAVGTNGEGRRNVLAIELASRESASSWKELLLGLRKRSLGGVEFVVSGDHAGLRRAIQEVLPEAVWQRCYVHFLRNPLDYLPRKADDDCLMELHWICDRRNLEEARQDNAILPTASVLGLHSVVRFLLFIASCKCLTTCSAVLVSSPELLFLVGS
jgi:putative transposase